MSKRLGHSDNGLGYEKDIKPHKWLAKIDWSKIESKTINVPYKPNV